MMKTAIAQKIGFLAETNDDNYERREQVELFFDRDAPKMISGSFERHRARARSRFRSE